jgi:hypothetical protein
MKPRLSPYTISRQDIEHPEPNGPTALWTVAHRFFKAPIGTYQTQAEAERAATEDRIAKHAAAVLAGAGRAPGPGRPCRYRGKQHPLRARITNDAHKTLVLLTRLYAASKADIICGLLAAPELAGGLDLPLRTLPAKPVSAVLYGGGNGHMR